MQFASLTLSCLSLPPLSPPRLPPSKSVCDAANRSPRNPGPQALPNTAVTLLTLTDPLPASRPGAESALLRSNRALLVAMSSKTEGLPPAYDYVQGMAGPGAAAGPPPAYSIPEMSPLQPPRSALVCGLSNITSPHPAC